MSRRHRTIIELETTAALALGLLGVLTLVVSAWLLVHPAYVTLLHLLGR